MASVRGDLWVKQGTANLAEDYCFIHKALRPVSKARRQIAAVPPANSRPEYVHNHAHANQTSITTKLANDIVHLTNILICFALFSKWNKMVGALSRLIHIQ